jgi:transcriptional regulator with PAS, ATPase and Fis domain
VKNDRFRKDLYFRLKSVSIEIPPLRERKEDILPLAEHFLQSNNVQNQTPKALSSAAVELLLDHNWPGNVRELESSIDTAVIMSRDKDTLLLEHFPYVKEHAQLMEESRNWRTPVTLREAEKDLILRTLKLHGDNRTQTARVLGITVKTLRSKLKQYGAFETLPDG